MRIGTGPAIRRGAPAVWRCAPGGILAVIAFALGLVFALSSAAQSATAVRVLLDRKVDGAAAPFLAAQASGLFRAEGLDVSYESGSDSQDALQRLAKGGADIAIANFDALIRFRDGRDAPELKAVFILFNRAPYALIARKSRGVVALGDVAGKTLGVAEGDPAIRLWPAVAKQNGIDPRKVKIEKISAAVRGPMLSAGQVDATTGLAYGTGIDLRDRGVPADDLLVLRFADYGCDSYGETIIVAPRFAAEHPEAVAGFVRGMVGGIKLAASKPAAAIDAALAQMDGASRAIELERLQTVLRENILTDEVKRDGLGDITPERFAAIIQQIAVDYKFHKMPVMSDIFDPRFLPPIAQRRIGGDRGPGDR